MFDIIYPELIYTLNLAVGIYIPTQPLKMLNRNDSLKHGCA
jgi:hypothetical protein